ncbi:hypothetical protein FOL47_002655 [Perkinsus chesapeaki]|uniref:Uncharacterized protein n=1 Tax=Perkinsus chesapeaki TaxID=330153 RepID=A0A7J6MCC0_PERCH|nr:hypothetical protein FOL47_002655 [Perkinsus chesapeaki]
MRSWDITLLLSGAAATGVFTEEASVIGDYCNEMCAQTANCDQSYCKNNGFCFGLYHKGDSKCYQPGSAAGDCDDSLLEAVRCGDYPTIACDDACAGIPSCASSDWGTYCKSWQAYPVCFGITVEADGSLCYSASDEDCYGKEYPCEETTTPEPTTVPETTTPEPTTVPETTTPEPTTVPETTAPEPTTVPETTTPEPTTVPETTTPESTAVPETTTPEPTTVPETTTPEPTTVPETTTPEPTTVPATTPEPTTVPETTTPEPTTVPETTTPELTTVPATTPEPTTVPATTPEPTTVPATTPEIFLPPTYEDVAGDWCSGTPLGPVKISATTSGTGTIFIAGQTFYFTYTLSFYEILITTSDAALAALVAQLNTRVYAVYTKDGIYLELVNVFVTTLTKC